MNSDPVSRVFRSALPGKDACGDAKYEKYATFHATGKQAIYPCTQEEQSHDQQQWRR